MIPEPFTAMASGLGLLSTLFALVVNSVQTNARLLADWITFPDTMIAYQTRIDNCASRFEKLSSCWKPRHHGRSADYEYILGPQALNGLAQRVSSVLAHEAAVVSLLSKGYEVDDTPSRSWRERVKWRRTSESARDQGKPSSSTDLESSTSAWRCWMSAQVQSLRDPSANHAKVEPIAPNALTKVAFVLIRSEEFKNKVSALETAVKTLEEFLRDRYERLPAIATTKPADACPEYFDEMLDFRDSAQRFFTDLSALTDVARGRGEVCNFQAKQIDHRETIRRLTHATSLSIELSSGRRVFHTREALYRSMCIVWPFSDDTSALTYSGLCQRMYTFRHHQVRFAMLTQSKRHPASCHQPSHTYYQYHTSS